MPNHDENNGNNGTPPDGRPPGPGSGTGGAGGEGNVNPGFIGIGPETGGGGQQASDGPQTGWLLCDMLGENDFTSQGSLDFDITVDNLNNICSNSTLEQKAIQLFNYYGISVQGECGNYTISNDCQNIDGESIVPSEVCYDYYVDGCRVGSSLNRVLYRNVSIDGNTFQHPLKRDECICDTQLNDDVRDFENNYSLFYYGQDEAGQPLPSTGFFTADDGTQVSDGPAGIYGNADCLEGYYINSTPPRSTYRRWVGTSQTNPELPDVGFGGGKDFNPTCPDIKVKLTLDKNNNLLYESFENIYTFQFNHNGYITDIVENVGDTYDYSFFVNFSDTVVVAFSPPGGNPLPAGQGTLIQIQSNQSEELSGEEILEKFTEFIFSDVNAQVMISTLELKRGCTDEFAVNYDDSAYIDDGSCGYSGCTDPNALNYDESNIEDDGSCEYFQAGVCKDIGALNYNPDEELDECTLIVFNINGGFFPDSLNEDCQDNGWDFTYDSNTDGYEFFLNNVLQGSDLNTTLNCCCKYPGDIITEFDQDIYGNTTISPFNHFKSPWSEYLEKFLGINHHRFGGQCWTTLEDFHPNTLRDYSLGDFSKLETYWSNTVGQTIGNPNEDGDFVELYFGPTVIWDDKDYPTADAAIDAIAIEEDILKHQYDGEDIINYTSYYFQLPIFQPLEIFDGGFYGGYYGQDDKDLPWNFVTKYSDTSGGLTSDQGMNKDPSLTKQELDNNPLLRTNAILHRAPYHASLNCNWDNVGIPELNGGLNSDEFMEWFSKTPWDIIERYCYWNTFEFLKPGNRDLHPEWYNQFFGNFWRIESRDLIGFFHVDDVQESLYDLDPDLNLTTFNINQVNLNGDIQNDMLNFNQSHIFDSPYENKTYVEALQQQLDNGVNLLTHDSNQIKVIPIHLSRRNYEEKQLFERFVPACFQDCNDATNNYWCNTYNKNENIKGLDDGSVYEYDENLCNFILHNITPDPCEFFAFGDVPKQIASQVYEMNGINVSDFQLPRRICTETDVENGYFGCTSNEQIISCADKPYLQLPVIMHRMRGKDGLKQADYPSGTGVSAYAGVDKGTPARTKEELCSDVIHENSQPIYKQHMGNEITLNAPGDFEYEGNYIDFVQLKRFSDGAINTYIHEYNHTTGLSHDGKWGWLAEFLSGRDMNSIQCYTHSNNNSDRRFGECDDFLYGYTLYDQLHLLTMAPPVFACSDPLACNYYGNNFGEDYFEYLKTLISDEFDADLIVYGDDFSVYFDPRINEIWNGNICINKIDGRIKRQESIQSGANDWNQDAKSSFLGRYIDYYAGENFCHELSTENICNTEFQQEFNVTHIRDGLGLDYDEGVIINLDTLGTTTSGEVISCYWDADSQSCRYRFWEPWWEEVFVNTIGQEGFGSLLGFPYINNENVIYASPNATLEIFNDFNIESGTEEAQDWECIKGRDILIQLFVVDDGSCTYGVNSNLTPLGETDVEGCLDCEGLPPNYWNYGSVYNDTTGECCPVYAPPDECGVCGGTCNPSTGDVSGCQECCVNYDVDGEAVTEYTCDPPGEGDCLVIDNDVNGVCDDSDILGCTDDGFNNPSDEPACNYNSQATRDDGSCFYSYETHGAENASLGCGNPNLIDIFDQELSTCCTCGNPEPHNQETASTPVAFCPDMNGNNLCDSILPEDTTIVCPGLEPPNYIQILYADGIEYFGCQDPNAENYESFYNMPCNEETFDSEGNPHSEVCNENSFLTGDNCCCEYTGQNYFGELTFYLPLHQGANLTSIPFLLLNENGEVDMHPNTLAQQIHASFAQVIDIPNNGCIDGIIGEGTAAYYNPTLGFLGSLEELAIGEGYWLKMNNDCFNAVDELFGDDTYTVTLRGVRPPFFAVTEQECLYNFDTLVNINNYWTNIIDNNYIDNTELPYNVTIDNLTYTYDIFTYNENFSYVDEEASNINYFDTNLALEVEDDNYYQDVSGNEYAIFNYDSNSEYIPFTPYLDFLDDFYDGSFVDPINIGDFIWYEQNECNQGVCFTFEERPDSQTSLVRLTSTVNISGWQITFGDNNCVIDAYGGVSQDSGFTISNSSDAVLAFSLTNSLIPPGEYLQGNDFLVEIDCGPNGCTQCFEQNLNLSMSNTIFSAGVNNEIPSFYPLPTPEGTYEGFEDLDNWFMTSNDGNPIDNLLTGLDDTINYSLGEIVNGDGLFGINENGLPNYAVFNYQENANNEPFVYQELQIPNSDAIQNFIQDALDLQTSGLVDDSTGDFIYEPGLVPTNVNGISSPVYITNWIFDNEYVNVSDVEAGVDLTTNDAEAITAFFDEMSQSETISFEYDSDGNGTPNFAVFPYQYGTSIEHEYEPVDVDNVEYLEDELSKIVSGDGYTANEYDITLGENNPDGNPDYAVFEYQDNHSYVSNDELGGVQIDYPDIPVSPVTTASTSKFISYPFQEDFTNGDFATILTNSWYDLVTGNLKNFDFFDTINIYYSTDGTDTQNIAAAYFGFWQVTTDTLNPSNIGTTNINIPSGAAIRFTQLANGGVIKWTI